MPGVAFVIVSLRFIDDSISGMRTFESYSAEMFIADARLIDISIAIKYRGNFIRERVPSIL